MKTYLKRTQEANLMNNFAEFSQDYRNRLNKAIELIPTRNVSVLAEDIKSLWTSGKQLFIIGNGGSAGNAIHLANDFLYGVSRRLPPRIKANALPANSAVLTCLANDEGYENIFIEQLKTLVDENDMVLAFSGSGNSANITKALEWCKQNEIKTHAILGYSGGQAKSLCDNPIHIPIDDMQISEDLQLIIGHMIMQWLCK